MVPDQETYILLGEIKGKLDSLHALVDKKVDNHEDRIHGIEKSRWLDRGVLGTLAGLFLYKFH